MAHYSAWCIKRLCRTFVFAMIASIFIFVVAQKVWGGRWTFGIILLDLIAVVASLFTAARVVVLFGVTVVSIKFGKFTKMKMISQRKVKRYALGKGVEFEHDCMARVWYPVVVKPVILEVLRE